MKSLRMMSIVGRMEDFVMKITRRQFLGRLAGAGALMGASGLLRAEEQNTAGPFKGTDMVPLGRTGINVSRLAQGTGYNGWARQCDHTRMGKEAFDRLLRHGLDAGIRFIDTADLYGTHPLIKDVIKGIPRDRFVLLSKVWMREEKWNKPSGGATEEFNRYCKELGVETIDICLMHCMDTPTWVEQTESVRNGLVKLKKKGAIRAVGVSCHDLGALKVAAANPWVDVIFARVNNKCGKQYVTDGSVEEVSAALKLARQNGKAVVGMKVFGAGKLTKPEQKDASLSYVFNNGLVDAITIGMKTPEEVDDTLVRMSRVKKV